MIQMKKSTYKILLGYSHVQIFMEGEYIHVHIIAL